MSPLPQATNPPYEPYPPGGLPPDLPFIDKSAERPPAVACPANYRDTEFPAPVHDFTVVVQWDEQRLGEQLMAKVATTVMCRWCRRIDKVLWQERGATP